MTNQQFSIIAHSLGVDTKKNKLPNEYYRNRFCAGGGHTDMPILRQLQELGWMEEGVPRESLGGASMWWVTETGLSAFKAEFEGGKVKI